MMTSNIKKPEYFEVRAIYYTSKAVLPYLSYVPIVNNIVKILIVLFKPHPMHVNTNISPTIFNGAYLQVCVDRIVWQGQIKNSTNHLYIYSGVSPIQFSSSWCLDCSLNMVYLKRRLQSPQTQTLKQIVVLTCSATQF